MSGACLTWACKCSTNIAHQFSHLSNHAAILTTLHVPLSAPARLDCHTQNWAALDSQAFQASLATHLCLLPAHVVDGTPPQSSLDAQVELITLALQRLQGSTNGTSNTAPSQTSLLTL
ncbi:hypothetical protein CROQUDRAFT_88149 [Cronartium quercuum f. sp. fusiforme G11]|uniref:Uncharacterized protein n=1 Tax=Cronartium quercuum f. sp. fusiforme G11 TaxID=708437 RepID=A0A9P6TF78_9BASI|nr:hypothetical protein CROQUDRAFT_88149 [Cronartium quercuum f. sp. fusiforme G11]